MSISNVATAVSPPSTPGSANSNFNFAEVGKIQATSSVVSEIALSIIFGILAIAGAVLIGVGTAASFGTLPLFLIAAGTLISAVLASIALISAVIENRAASVPEAEAIELDGELPIVKLPDNASLHEIEQHENLCAYIDEGNKEEGRAYKNGIHPHFVRDCVRDRFNVSVNGQTLQQLFLEPCSQMEALQQTRASLQKQANESGDSAIQAQADQVDENITAYKEDLHAKMVEELSRAVAEKLGENSPLLAPISLALCQDLRIMLENKMQKLSLDNYHGSLIHRGVDSKISYTSALEFPAEGDEGDIVAKITVEGAGQYKAFIPTEVGKMCELEAPCDYVGKAIVCINQAGQTSIDSTVRLSSQQ